MAQDIVLVLRIDDQGTRVIQSFSSQAKEALGKTAAAASVPAAAFQNTANKLESVARGIGNFGRTMGLTIAALTAGIAFGTRSIINMGAELWQLQQKTGISTEELSKLRLSAEKSGVSLQGVAFGLRFLSRNLVAASQGARGASKLFNDLKISVKDTNTGALRPSIDVLGDLADKFAAMEDGEKKTTLAMRIFGRAGSELIPFLNLGRKGMKENADIAEKLGLIISGPTAKAMDELQGRMIVMKMGFQSAYLSLATQLMPTITSFVAKVTETFQKVKKWAEAHPALTKAIGEFGFKLMIAGTALTPILIAVPKLIMMFNLLKVAIVGLSSPAGLVVIALAAIGIAILDVVKRHKEALDDMTRMAKASMIDLETNSTTYLLMIQKVQKEGGATLDQWKNLTFKFGKDYVQIFTEITTKPEYAKLKGLLEGVIDKQKALSHETRALEDTTISSNKTLREQIRNFQEAKGAISAHTKDFADDIKAIAASAGMLPAEEIKDKIKDMTEAMDYAQSVGFSYNDVLKIMAEQIVALGDKLIPMANMLKIDVSKAFLDSYEASKKLIASSGTLATAAKDEADRRKELIKTYEEGIPQMKGLTDEYDALQAAIDRYSAAGVSNKELMKAYGETIETLYTKALLSEKLLGIKMPAGLAALAGRMYLARTETQKMGLALGPIGNALELAYRRFMKLTEAARLLGVTAKSELIASLEEAEKKYEEMLKAGELTAKEQLVALQAIIDKYKELGWVISDVTKNKVKELTWATMDFGERFDFVMRHVMIVLGQMNAAYDAVAQSQLMRIDNEYRARKKAIDASMKSDEEKYFAVEALDREMERRRIEIQRKQAVFQKLSSIAQAIMNTKEAITAMLKLPPPLNFIMAAVVAALGAIQVAAIIATPLPSYAKGGVAGQFGPEVVRVGEEGREIISPIPVMKETFREVIRETGPASIIRLSIPIRLEIGDQVFHRQVVKDINLAGKNREITVPIEVIQ
jgi:hypothetical protein